MPITTDLCTIAGMELEEIGARIAAEREKRGMSQSDLARALVISPQAVQKWEAGGQPRFSRLAAVAEALSMPLAELVRGTAYEAGLQTLDDSATTVSAARERRKAERKAEIERARAEYQGKLPVISWVQAGNWTEVIDNFHPGDAEDWIPCPFNHGPHAFILRVVGESNYDPTGPKSYSPGDYIAVDPSREAINRSMVVVRIDHEERATFKQLVTDEDGVVLLKALNPNWPNRIFEMPKGSRIVGTVIGKWVPE